MYCNKLLPLFLIVSFSQAKVYEGPNPLQNIKIDCVISQKDKIFSYNYTITNPATNNGEIWSFDMFLNQNKETDTVLSNKGLTPCSKFFRVTSQNANEKYFMPAVGSTSPDGWNCSYGTLHGYSYGSYGWGASDEVNLIKPGKSMGGFELTSYGLPAIRDILTRPDIDKEKLPSEYDENLEKTEALENKVKWMGQTVGPKAPPKNLEPAVFIQFIIDSKEKAFSLGWIDNKGVKVSLDAKLDSALKKIKEGDKKTALNILNAFLSEVEAQRGKHLSSEAYALLYFNAKYLIENMK